MVRKVSWMLVVLMALGVGAQAQNLVNNADFGNGLNGWGKNGGTYAYTSGPYDIARLGWWNGVSIWQNTGAVITAGESYTLTVQCRQDSQDKGQGQAEGVTLTMSGVSGGWNTIVPNTTFWLKPTPNGGLPGPAGNKVQPGNWHHFSISFKADDHPGLIGQTIGVGVRIADTNKWGQYGWLGVNLVSLTRDTTNAVAVDTVVSEVKETSVRLIGFLPESYHELVGAWFSYRRASQTDWTDTAYTGGVYPGDMFTEVVKGLRPGTNYVLRVHIDGKDGVDWAGYDFFKTAGIAPVPMVVDQPQDAYVDPGSTAMLSISAAIEPAAPLSYQWYFIGPVAGDEPTDGSGHTPVGTNSPTLALENVSDADEGSYYCVVSAEGEEETATSNQARIIVKESIGHWPLDGDPNDASGNGHDGSLVGMAASWGPGMVGDALHLGGDDAFVSVPDDADFHFGAKDSYTLSFWVFVEVLPGGWNALVTRGRQSGGGAKYMGVWIAPQGGVTTWYYGPWPSWGGSILEAGWIQVTVVQDGIAGTRQLYVNGVLDSELGAIAADADGDLLLGTDQPTSKKLNGILDDVRLYNYALSADEINALPGLAPAN